MEIGYQEINATRRVSYLIAHADNPNNFGCLIPSFIVIIMIAMIIASIKEMFNV